MHGEYSEPSYKIGDNTAHHGMPLFAIGVSFPIFRACAAPPAARTNPAVQCIENACALPAKEPILGNIEFEIEWTELASKVIQKLYKAGAGKPSGAQEPPVIALPPLECLPAEGDVLFLGPGEHQKAFIVAERQYHHEGGPDWKIVLILDVLEYEAAR